MYERHGSPEAYERALDEAYVDGFINFREMREAASEYRERWARGRCGEEGETLFQQSLTYPQDDTGEYTELVGEVVKLGTPIGDDVSVQVKTARGTYTGYTQTPPPKIGNWARIRIYRAGGGWYPDNIITGWWWFAEAAGRPTGVPIVRVHAQMTDAELSAVPFEKLAAVTEESRMALDGSVRSLLVFNQAVTNLLRRIRLHNVEDTKR